DRHPARGARRPAAEDWGQERPRPGRRRPPHADPDRQGCTAGLSNIYCQECGFQNPEAANYCARCGALLVKDEGGSETTQTFTPDEGEDTSSEALEDLGITGPALVVRSGGGRAGETFHPEGETSIGRSPDYGIFLDE